MYQYWGFGLHILSEIKFPEFLPASFAEPELTIRIGKTPERLTGSEVIEKVRVSISPTQYLQKLNGIANYYAAHGKEIYIEPMPEADEKSIRLFTLSNAMAAILHQRNLIPLHASAVHYKGELVLFCGPSGVGKSTIVTMLQAKGYKVFSDDVCVLQPSENHTAVHATSSYPMMKLWADTFPQVGLEIEDENMRLRPKLLKYARFLHDNFDTTALPIRQIFVLNRLGTEKSPEIVQMGSLESFNALQHNSYRHVQMNAMKKRNFHFSIMSKLAATVPVFNLSRSNHYNTIPEIVELVESHLV